MNKKEKINVAEIYSRFGIFIILMVTLIISAVISPAFLSATNVINVIRQNVTIGIVACGAQLVLLCGDVDLSSGSIAAFAGCFAAMVQVASNNLFLALLTGIVIGACLGFVNGLIITRCEIPSFIMTLATQQAARGAILAITKAKPIPGLDGFTWFGQGYVGPIPVPIIIWVIVLIITGFILNKMRFGRYVYAVGGNRAAASASGIKVKNIITKCFTFSGLMAGLGGVVLMARVNSGQPNGGEQLEFDAITAVIIGGTSMSGGVGNIYGTIAGALFVGFLINIMTLLNVGAYYQQIVKGVIIALAVIIDVIVRKGSKK